VRITSGEGYHGFVEELIKISKKWRDVWERANVYESDPDPRRPKYFLTAAFMYPNGVAHVGHARTYLIPDILARYKRGQGFNVLFPMGFHYTGTPILTTAERIASGDMDYVETLSRSYNIPVDVLLKLTDPLRLARYFHELSKEAMKDYGLSIDWRREFTTVDPEFKSFIRWQFTKLKEKGLLVKGSHPVGWCPNHNMPVGMHDTKDDVEPEIGELTIIKFFDSEGLIFPAATLRPETVLGVTNMWINPDLDYCVSEISEGGRKERWVLSCEAAEKLTFQKDVKVVERVKGSVFVGRDVTNPITGEEVPVIGATFVSPKFGTGVVMSVPAHAPYDYAALRDYLGGRPMDEWGRLRPVRLIQIEGYGEYPAAEVVERLGVKSQDDKDLLDRATKEVYKAEHDRGVMVRGLSERVVKEVIPGAKTFIKDVVECRGVNEIRERIKDFLVSNGYSSLMYEIMNAPVYCRCGTEIVVKVVKDQWFIDYGNEEWKEKARAALASMRIVPEEARKQFLATMEWLREKACARSRGLGTELPWAKGWIIESLSDSTIYMAFYTVIHRIREFGIRPEALTTEFWNYVMLGEGDPKELGGRLGIDPKHLEELRKEFDYWYPLDSRHSGKDLIPNHLTFFIFNHAAIFPENKWPRQIVANGWVLLKGEKMSKSKGNVRTLRGLIDSFSPDAVRLAIATEAEVEGDLNLDLGRMGRVYDRLRKIMETVRRLSKASGDTDGLPEKWLRTRIARHILLASEELDRVRVRAASVRLFYLVPQDIDEYLSMVEEPSKTVREAVEYWLKALSIVTPFTAEELWHEIGKETLIVSERWPSIETLKQLIDEEIELSMEYVFRVVEDIRSIRKVVEGEEVVIYVAPKETQSVLPEIRRIIEEGGTVGDVIKHLISSGFAEKRRAPKTAKTLLDLVMSMDPHIVDSLEDVGGIDERNTLLQLRKYIERKAGVKVKAVYYATDEEAPNLGGKKGQALPWRPSIYIS